MVVFAPQNVIMDPPFTKLDLLSCRNLLIYLSPELQKKLLPLFHYSLNPGGLLFLGSAETIGTFTDLFVAVDGQDAALSATRARRRHDARRVPLGLRSPGSAAGAAAARASSALERGRRTCRPSPTSDLLQRFAPPAVLVEPTRATSSTSAGGPGKYLEPAAGKANWNIFAMAREGLRDELGSAFRRRLARERTVERPRRSACRTGAAGRRSTSTVEPHHRATELAGTVMIVVHGRRRRRAGRGPAPSERKSRRAARRSPTLARRSSQRAPRRARSALREEMQTSQEELKSANEELQSTNEELQSTNEELTTSKEEMQSMNEELQTVNHELQAKVDELSRVEQRHEEPAQQHRDRDALPRRRAARPALHAEGHEHHQADPGRRRPADHRHHDRPRLPRARRRCARGAAHAGLQRATRVEPRRSLVQRAHHALPHLDDRIDGLVITFTDVTALKTLEQSVNEKRHEAV